MAAVHRRNYTVLELWTAGQRMLDDFSEDDAVETYLKLHPEAKKDDVRAQLKKELAGPPPEALRDHTVAALYASGRRFMDDYTEADAIADYLKLHPEANEDDVRADLKKERAMLDEANPDFDDRRFFDPVDEDKVGTFTDLASKPGGLAYMGWMGIVRAPDGRFYHDVRTELGAVTVKDHTTYTVGGLYAAGLRFCGDYDQEAAIKHYLELHPEAKEDNVRAELKKELGS